MEKEELHSRLESKLANCWDAYVEDLLKQSPSVLISRAGEIAAASLCYDELVGSYTCYPEDLLEHLLQYDDPLEAIRDQWIEEQDSDHSIDFEHALWSLREYGPEPGKTLSMDGIS